MSSLTGLRRSNMDTSKLKPNDPRVKYETTEIRGKTYSYILGEPEGPKRDTILLVHGWPDMAFGWRNQIPFFMSLGFQVVAPNMVGYAGTDAPQDLSNYTMKSVSDDIKELAKKFVGEDGQIVLGGHDWGGAVVWRAAYYYPELIKAVFTVCTPLTPFHPQFAELEELNARGIMTTFTYQIQLGGPEVQERLQGKDKLRQFFTAMYGSKNAEGKVGFTVDHGFHFDRFDGLVGPTLLSPEELDYYVDQYSLQPTPELRGPLNWYRTRRLNFEEEEHRALNGPPLRFEMPALFIAASKDHALPPSMSIGMEKAYASLTRGEVNASHWALTEAAAEVNANLGKWLNEVYDGAFKAQL
ncbi:Epoxide hydrolase srdG [Cladobotryum mycophilum]|uniref:Epoxide hydrolase srdG n=1 Tax=Cladobotryum mycophilum TaxID=491253 RepID=A0ABR0SE97_9HYPO